MNFLKQTFLRISIYVILAGFLAGFAWFKFFKPDSVDVIEVGGSNGRYYVKFKEFNSKSDIEIRIVKLLNKVNNDQILVFEGGYKLNEGCDMNINSIDDLLNKIDYYNESQNRLMFINKKCYLEKN